MAVAAYRVHARLGRAPLVALALALLVTVMVLLPPIYLLARAAAERASIVDALAQRSTVEALGRTLLLTVTVTTTCAALAIPLAWLTTRTDLPGARAWTVLLALPLAIPSFVGSFVVVSALGPTGLLQDVLEPLGVSRLPSIYGFAGAWFVLSAFTYPYTYLQVCAALSRGDRALEEAARSLGSGPWQTFLRVNLPQLRPAIAAGAVLTSLYVVSEFGAVAMLRYDTLTPLVYIEYTTSFSRGTAAVLGIPLLVIAAVLVTLDVATRGAARYHARGQRRPGRRLPLGRWRAVALAACILVTALGVAMPVFVVLYWLVEGVQAGAASGFVPEAILNTARAAGFGAFAAAVAALPIAMLSVRHPSWLSGLLERAAYAGQALPAITIALALVFFGARYLTPLYQTLVLLVFAYMVRFLPEALGATRTALLQINPNGEEAARSLGAGPLRTLVSITLPQMVPGISAGMLLVFLTAVKELPITLLLAPIGFETLSTEIWAATSEAFYARAALPSLVLLLLSAAAVLLMLRRERLS